MAEKKSLRAAYGQILLELAETMPNLVVVEADLSKSTMGKLFGDAWPDRFFDVGIAEANMAGVAAGLSLTGKVPFMASFAVFATGRCYDQLRNGICLPKLNVKVCGSSAGLSDYGDGSTHQSVEDIATMRALPNMQVFCPADAVQTAQMVRYMAQNPGPMYLRINRNDLPVVTDASIPFEPGRIYPLRPGSDAAVFATGVTVGLALDAAELLAQEGISLQVVNVPSLKPVDEAAVAAVCQGVRGVVTAEEHSVIGGLGSLVADIAAKLFPVRMVKVGIEDRFGTSAKNYPDLLEAYGLTAQNIARAVKASLA